jgi:hypothetical protein
MTSRTVSGEVNGRHTSVQSFQAGALPASVTILSSADGGSAQSVRLPCEARMEAVQSPRDGGSTESTVGLWLESKTLPGDGATVVSMVMKPRLVGRNRELAPML